MAGKLLFLHANFRPKFSLDLPADFAAYTRRWQVVQPGKLPFVDLMAATDIGPEVDFEHEVYNVSQESSQPPPCQTMAAAHTQHSLGLPQAEHMCDERG